MISPEFKRFPSEWKVLPFLEVFEDVTSKGKKVKKENYQTTGDIPVVDQGQKFFGGYTDEANKITGVELPAIVFGDHTKTFKYVEVDFAIGADGVKLLNPKVGADKKFLFYYLKQLKLEDAGYSRHFKFLKETYIPHPPLETQKQIAAVLEKADQLRKDCQQMEQELNSLAQSVFIDMFGDPVTNPKGWTSSSLESEMQFLTSGSRGWAKYYDDEGDSIFIRIQNVLKDKLSLSDIQKISPPSTKEAIRTKVQDGDILLSITADLGRACVVKNIELDSYISQHLALIRTEKSTLVPEFLSAFLISPAGIGQFKQMNKGGTKAGLNFSDIRSLKILLPPRELQVKFKLIKEDLDEKLEQLKHAAKIYDDLFNSLMQKAFKGELNR
ncbi:restriction endonuclease subunit S [Vibrio tasmaniensis]|uniref:restriction endonuclease subunit S n=1 Tax=Vibrio tasmaniensis TaxID=212663 RepID=UPI001F0EB0EB|nr:restriction endonuclease subunit S [Vibrio tasmaniensis]